MLNLEYASLFILNTALFVRALAQCGSPLPCSGLLFVKPLLN
jgi:hypothetical protein